MTLRHLAARKAALSVLVFLLTLGVAGAAYAYWSGTGSASATATTATLSAPTGVSATADGATVSVRWSAPTTVPTGATLGYRVTQAAGASSSVVCGPTTPVSGTSCAFTATASGTYTYTVTAVLGSWTATSDPSAPVVVSLVSKLAVTSAPVTGAASSSPNLGPITVQLQDAGGRAATATGATTVTLSSNSTGTARFAPSPGAAAVTSLSIPAGTSSVNFYYGDTKAGSPTITVAATGLTGATQSETITAASAAKLAFGQQPSGTVAGVAIAPAPTVVVQDAFGNQTTSGTNVTVALGANPAAGTLSGTTTVAAVSGAATFSGLSINKVGTGYTLAATGVGTGATSAAFAVTPAAPVKLVITSAAVSGAASATATLGPVTVQMQDVYGNSATAAATTTVTLSSNTAGSATFAGAPGGSAVTSVTILSGSSSVSFYYGDTNAGSPTITAAATGLTGATQGETITAASAAKLAFGQQPSGTVAGVAIAPAPTVVVQDAFGNQTTSGTNVTVALGANPAAGTLSGTTTVAAVSGTATFSGLSINKVGTGYTLAATGVGTGATSAAFAVTPAAPSKLTLTSAQTSGDASASATLGPLTLTAQDVFGNPAPVAEATMASLSSSATTTSRFALTSGGASVTSVTIGTGQTTATFYYGDTKVGSPVLTAAATGLGQASTSVQVLPGAVRTLSFSTQPLPNPVAKNGSFGVAVTVVDQFGNLVNSASVALALTTPPNGTNLQGTTTQTTGSNGVASFSGLSVNKAGTYTLTASSAGATPIQSNFFTQQ